MDLFYSKNHLHSGVFNLIYKPMISELDVLSNVAISSWEKPELKSLIRIISFNGIFAISTELLPSHE